MSRCRCWTRCRGYAFPACILRLPVRTKPGGSNEQSLAELETLVSRLRPAHYMTGHIRHQPDMLAVLADAGCRTIVSIRDRRAIALSAANYMRSNQRHPLNARGLAELPELDDRINAVITGICDRHRARFSRAGRTARALPAVAGRARGVCRALTGSDRRPGWRLRATPTRPGCRYLRFLDLPVDDAVVDRVAESIYSTKSATFRLGQIDSWRHQMSSRHMALINELCQPQMLRMGYPAS